MAGTNTPTEADQDFGAAMRSKMREAVEDGTPLILLTCTPDAYHLLVDGAGLTNGRVLLLLRAAVRNLERQMERAEGSSR